MASRNLAARIVTAGRVLVGVAALTCGSVVAQEQTGAPPGVPVPPAPPATDRAGSAPAGPIPPDSHVFRIRLVDGRNGNAIENARVRVWYDEWGDAGYLLTTNSQGVAVMPEPVGVPVRVLFTPEDRMDCRKATATEPAPAYNLQAIAATGVAAPNRCGPVQVKPRPGELVLFARPLRWYEGINRQ